MARLNRGALLVALAALVVVALLIAGCGGGGSTTAETTTSTAETTGSETPEAETTEPETSTVALGTEPSSEWPTIGGDIGGQRYSVGTQITPENVAELKPAFVAQLDPPSIKEGYGGENNPIVIGEVIYASSSSGPPTVGAYSATTGKAIWQKSASELGVPYTEQDTGERGLSYGEGKVFINLPNRLASGGGLLVALNAENGELLWKTIVNPEKGVEPYSQPTAVYWDGAVYVGMSGDGTIHGDTGTYTAVDSKTGKVKWIFHTMPQENEEAAETWGTGKMLKKYLEDGGAAVWTNAVIDPELGIIYVPVANVDTHEHGDFRHFKQGIGKELYGNSLLALDLKTGKLKWYFQAVHHDEWDYDCITPPILWNHEINGEMVKGVSMACKSGYVYELNRETGEPVTPVKEEPLANAKTDPEAKKEMEALGWQLEGGKPMTEPIPVGAGEVVPHCADPKLLPKKSPDGSNWHGKPFDYSCAFSYYSTKHFVAGQNEDGLDWQPPSYDPKLGYSFYCAKVAVRAIKVLNPNAQSKENDLVWPEEYENGEVTEPRTGLLTALDVENNKLAWQQEFAKSDECVGGTATTAGGVLFTADFEGHFLAYDSKTGEKLWTYSTPGMMIDAPPIVYEAGGEEYVAVVATLEGKAVLMAFSLNGKAKVGEPEPAAGGAAKEMGGEAVFKTNCGTCHTLAAAGTTGTVGPNLDTLKPSDSLVEHQVTHGGGKMPAFGGVLSEEEIKEVAKYVSEEAGTKG